MKPLTVGALSLFLSGCAVGPNYLRPPVSTPAQWTTPPPRSAAKGMEAQIDLWWKSFHDPELDSLIQRAVEANYDLQRATARVEEARAATGIARANYSPQVGAVIGVSRSRQVGVGLLPETS